MVIGNVYAFSGCSDESTSAEVIDGFAMSLGLGEDVVETGVVVVGDVCVADFVALYGGGVVVGCGQSFDVGALRLVCALVEDDIEFVVFGFDGELGVIPLLTVYDGGVTGHGGAWPFAEELSVCVPGIKIDGGEVGFAVYGGGVWGEAFFFFSL